MIARHVLRRAVLILVPLACLTVLLGPATSRASSSDGCAITGDKIAAPTRVSLGEEVQIRLTLNAACPPASHYFADVVVVIDRSTSMASSLKLDAAIDMAHRFVTAMDLSVHRVALVSFYRDAHLELGLSEHQTAITNAIHLIRPAGPQTNLAAAMDVAYDELAGSGRLEALLAVLVLSDGKANYPELSGRQEALASADRAKQSGMRIFTVGVGPAANMDEELLKSLASSESDYYELPAYGDSEGIYLQIAEAVGKNAPRHILVLDTLSSDVDLVAGSASPGAVVNGRDLQWTADSLPAGGLAWVYRVLPNRPGVFPANARAVASYDDGDGVRHTFEFARPVITVDDVMPDMATPTPRPTGSPTALCVCGSTRNRVPPAVILHALANPDRYYGWQYPLDPGKPAGPANPPRDCLSLLNWSSPFHPLYNSVIWRVGCP